MFLRKHPSAVASFRLREVRVGGKVFYTNGAARARLRSAGISDRRWRVSHARKVATLAYNEWAIRHRRAAPNASASSVERPELGPTMAVDGSTATRWASAHLDGQWWQIDLGSVRSISGVRLNWARAYASRYRVSTSVGGKRFAVATEQTIDGPGWRSTGFAPRAARYVRILGVSRATRLGISLRNARVYRLGPRAAGRPPASPELAKPGEVTEGDSSEQPVDQGAAPAALPRFGISPGYKILNRSPADRAFELDQMKGAGAQIVRLDYVEPEKADVVIEEALARGLEPLLCVGGTTRAPGPSLSDYTALATTAAARWGGKVRFFELMNEPNLNGWTSATYTPYLKEAYAAIKRSSPGATVLTGGFFTAPPGTDAYAPSWMQGIYAHGGKGSFDMVAVHLYEDPKARGAWNIWDQTFSLTPSVRSVMDANGDGDKLIVSTESGANVDKVGEEKQAITVRDAYTEFASRPNTGFIIQYSMMNDDVNGYGMLRDDRSRRPVWDVFHQLATGT